MTPTTVPLSDLSRHTTNVTALVADGDVTLTRRDAADLFLSTVERHQQEAEGLRITTAVLASLAKVRPDLAGEALTETLPWMTWLPTDDKTACLGELLADLRAGAETGELRPFFLNLAAWQSTAIAWGVPELRAALTSDVDDADYDMPVVERPGA